MKRFSALIPVCLSLVACGGGGSPTPTPTPNPSDPTPTTPTPSSVNAEAVSTGYAGIQSASQMLSADNAGNYMDIAPTSNGTDGSGFRAQPLSSDLRKSDTFEQPESFVSSAMVQSEDIDTFSNHSIEETMEGDCGGDAVFNIVGDQDPNEEPQFPLELDMEMEFNDYCEEFFDGSQTITDGVIDANVRLESETSLEMSFNFDMSVTEIIDGETFNAYMEMSMSCIIEGDNEECEFSTEFTDDNGTLFSLYADDESGDFGELDKENVNFNGKFTATVDGDVSEFDLLMSDVNAQACDNGNFSSGTLMIKNEEKGDIEITFNDCDTFTITHNGTSDVLNQKEG